MEKHTLDNIYLVLDKDRPSTSYDTEMLKTLDNMLRDDSPEKILPDLVATGRLNFDEFNFKMVNTADFRPDVSTIAYTGGSVLQPSCGSAFVTSAHSAVSTVEYEEDPFFQEGNWNSDSIDEDLCIPCLSELSFEIDPLDGLTDNMELPPATDSPSPEEQAALGTFELLSEQYLEEISSTSETINVVDNFICSSCKRRCTIPILNIPTDASSREQQNEINRSAGYICTVGRVLCQECLSKEQRAQHHHCPLAIRQTECPNKTRRSARNAKNHPRRYETRRNEKIWVACYIPNCNCLPGMGSEEVRVGAGSK